MTIRDALGRIHQVVVEADAPPVALTAARRLARVGGGPVVRASGTPTALPIGGRFVVGMAARPESPDGDAARLRLDADGTGRLILPHHGAYGFVVHLVERLASEPVEPFAMERRLPLAFAWQRSVYDFFLTQEGRIQHGLDKRAYVEALAARGFTHVEVNGLAFREAIESGPEGEIYPMFYTYCPALDQFVSTALNAGLYPAPYLAANLRTLEENATLAVEYGLTPGLVCFEPRSVPDAFFERHPMLRGARVDHPFRSFKPRFNMTVTHPLVLEHYGEMVRKLMDAVPALGFLSVWSNDSGAGFEYTKSLYVGRNGGAYLIREWKDDHEIARCAGANVIRFLSTLLEAGRVRNPSFRVLTRLESFYGEHEAVWPGLANGLDVETTSLTARGWEMPYTHPHYDGWHAINAGSVHQMSHSAGDRERAEELERRHSHAHFYVAAGPHAMFAPLVGVPYPRLTGRRLQMLHAAGVRYVAHLGGTPAPWLVPFDPNHEMAAAIQFDPGVDVDDEARRMATRWAGADHAAALLEAWSDIESAVMAYPGVSPLYSMYGFVWYRLWVRPLVPDIEAIAETDRAYYQAYMCTTPHNPNNVDLARDVLFQLATPESCRLTIARMDAHVWAPLDSAIDRLARARADAGNGHAGGVFEDQWIRARALRCWLRTQHSVASWIVAVHGYQQAKAAGDAATMAARRAALDEMIDREIANTEALVALAGSTVEFMATTDQGETPLIHGRNLVDLLERRMALMRSHRTDEPRVDPGYIERVAAEWTAARGES